MNMSVEYEKNSVRLDRVGICFGTGARRVEAVRELGFELRAGEFVSVLGPSGCGKSTLIGAIAGLTKVSSGGVFFGGKPIDRPSPERGVVFQHHTLLPWKTVFGNVEFGLKQRGIRRAARARQVQEILSEVGLAEFARHYPVQLSGGMQQRVNLARALVNGPELLLMDEPFAALDAQTRLSMQQLLLRLWGRHRMTVMFVTHDIDEALFLSDRVLVLSQRPAQIRADLPVPVCRPRDTSVLTSQVFTHLKRRCLALLSGADEPAPDPETLRTQETRPQPEFSPPWSREVPVV